MEPNNDKEPERIPGGAFLVSRKIFDSGIWLKHPLYLKTWLWLIGQANHGDREERGRQFKRGEIVTTYDKIMDSASYYHNKAYIRPTLKQIRIMLSWFEEKGMVKVEAVRASNFLTGADPRAHTRAYVGIRIVVVNYDTYQSIENYKGTHQGRPTSSQGHNNNNVIRKNSRSALKEADPRVKPFLTFWGETFQKETGEQYPFAWAKETQLIKGLPSSYDLPKLQELVRQFFRDEQCKRRGLNIGIFRQEISRLIGLKGLDPLEQAKREMRRL